MQKSSDKTKNFQIDLIENVKEDLEAYPTKKSSDVSNYQMPNLTSNNPQRTKDMSFTELITILFTFGIISLVFVLFYTTLI